MSLRVVKKTCVDVCFLVQGMLENNVYFISDGEATMVVDPSSDAEEIMRELKACADVIHSTDEKMMRLRERIHRIG